MDKKEKSSDNTSQKKSKEKKDRKQNNSKEKHPRILFSLKIKFSLAIIILTSIIIAIMTYYFINEESKILTNEIIKFAEREIEHLTNTAKESISQKDELPLVAAIKNIQKITSIKYVYILDNKNRILQNFNPKMNGKILDDDIKNSIGENKKKAMIVIPDPDDREGSIYNFTMSIMHPYKKRRIGTTRIGFSDKIIRDEVSKIKRTVMLIGLFFLAFSIFGAIVLASITVNPIRKLTKGASAIGAGELDYTIDVTRSDELGQLAFEFNLMSKKLKKAKELEIEKRLMEDQLDLAKEIQEGLNPMGYYEKDGIEIKGYTRAAKGVGGDYFDYIDIDEKRVGALISDVSGKGVPASLVMVMIRTVFVSYMNRKNVECAGVLGAINNSLGVEFAIDKFATLFFMIYDRQNEELSFANAGHGPLFCYRNNLKSCTLTKLDGMPIGIMEDVEYQQAKVKFFPGDVVVLYTDGITEMRNEEKEEYGLNRVQKFLINNPNLSAKEFIEQIVDDVDEYRGNAQPHDDMTILVMKRIM